MLHAIIGKKFCNDVTSVYGTTIAPARKLLFFSISTSVSNYNLPEADKSSKYFNGWMPVPLVLSGVVIILAFLDLGKNS